MAVREYIGARYVTKIYENSQDPSSAEWEGGVNYEPLTMVTYNYGSYLSKKDVPASIGDPSSNPLYWVQTGFYNGQISALQAAVQTLEGKVDILNNGIVFPETYGAVADGVTDCTAAIQDAIDENPDSIIYFGGGVYSITSTLTGKNGIHFVISTNSTIRADAAMEVMIYTDIVESSGDPTAKDRNTLIVGGIIDANYNANYCIGHNNCIGATFKNIYIKNFNKAGIHNRFRFDGVDTGVSASNYYEDLYIMIENPIYNADTYGIIANGQDCIFNTITMVNCKTGFYCKHGGHFLSVVHVWNYDAAMYKDTVAFNICGRMQLNMCSADGPQYGLRVNNPNAPGSATSVIILNQFMNRHATDYVSDAQMQAAGGFFLYDIESNVNLIFKATNTDQETNYTASYGKFVNDSLYNSADIYKHMRFKNTQNSSAISSIPNYVGDMDEFDQGVILPDGIDLNNYKTPGLFRTLSLASAQTMSNVPTGAPFDSSGFGLKVQFEGAFIRQTITSASLGSAPCRTTRATNSTVPGSGSWGPWIAY